MRPIECRDTDLTADSNRDDSDNFLHLIRLDVALQERTVFLIRLKRPDMTGGTHETGGKNRVIANVGP